MDEPAAGLDPRARVELRELLRVLAGKGKAILISSHILTELAEICSGAVIIEQGKLLMAGSIDQLLTTNVAHRTILVRPLERQEELYRELLQTHNVQAARLVGADIAVDVNGSDEVCADILSALVGRGFRLIEFKQDRANLEDIFMNITRGEVQ
jgi:ABC-2 type transport system ATP-binding protein